MQGPATTHPTRTTTQRETATVVLGLDDRVLNGSDETSGMTGDCHVPFCGSPGVRSPRATRRLGPRHAPEWPSRDHRQARDGRIPAERVGVPDGGAWQGPDIHAGGER